MCFKKFFFIELEAKTTHIFWTKPGNSDQSDKTACLTVECAATRNMAHLTSTVFCCRITRMHTNVSGVVEFQCLMSMMV
jgi:hypothetical protein